MGVRRCNRNCNRNNNSSKLVSAILVSLAATAITNRCSVLAQSTATGSASSSPTSNAAGCVTGYDPLAEVDYFPDKVEVEYAQKFSVEYSLTYKVLTIEDSVYVLYQCGTPEPVLEGETVQQYISVPVTKVATGTPDHIPRIELLGHRASLVAFTGDVSLIGSPCVDGLVEDGTVIEATTYNETCSENVVDNAALVELDVDVAFGDSLFVAYYSGAPATYKGVGIMTYAETGETTGLAHGEAVKLFSLFYNEEAKGTELFEEIESLWLCTKNNAQGCSLKLEDAPTVAWFPYLPTDTSSTAWVDAGSGWDAPKANSYYSYAVENTGGVLLDCNFTGLMSDKKMLNCFADADVCVFAEDYASVEDVFDPEVLSQLACVKNDTVYDITLSGVNAWFESISVEPHVLMEDMVVALHGEDYNYGIGSYERLLLRHVATEESGSGTYFANEGTCADSDMSLEIQGECDIIIDFTTCDGNLETDGQSPASRALPGALGSAALLIATIGAIVAGQW